MWQRKFFVIERTIVCLFLVPNKKMIERYSRYLYVGFYQHRLTIKQSKFPKWLRNWILCHTWNGMFCWKKWEILEITDNNVNREIWGWKSLCLYSGIKNHLLPLVSHKCACGWTENIHGAQTAHHVVRSCQQYHLLFIHLEDIRTLCRNDDDDDVDVNEGLFRDAISYQKCDYFILC